MVELYVRSCLTCQRTHPGLGLTDVKRLKHPMDEAFDSIYIDLWGPFDWNGSRYTLLTMIDFMTKWAEISVEEEEKYLHSS